MTTGLRSFLRLGALALAGATAVPGRALGQRAHSTSSGAAS
jgi:hypothetical protein